MKVFKTIIILLSLVVLSSCKDKTTASTNPVIQNKDHLAIATNMAKTILEKQKAGLFHELKKENATIAMVTGLTEERQKSSYQKIKGLFGDYQSLEFHSVKGITQKEKLEIYRFKGNFEQSDDVEVRVVLNSNGKLAGFFILPWKDTL